MGIDLRIPNINAATTEEQVAQIKSSLIQLTEQLNWAFNSISGGQSMDGYRVLQTKSSEGNTEEEAKNTFSTLKSLIIKSADIVEAYYKEFGVMLETEGKYMAVSDFGTYYEESSQVLEAKYDSLETKYENLQKVVDPMGETVEEISNNALIKSGMLKYVTMGEYEGMPLYGVEIRQKTVSETTGEIIYHKLARLSSDGLELYANPDSSYPSAIFKYDTMYITNAEVKGTLQLGGYKVTTSKGLSFKWAGKEE